MKTDIGELAVRFACILMVMVAAYSFYEYLFSCGFIGEKHIEPEKVSCTVLSVSHDFVGWLGRERFSVVVEADGKIYDIHDRDTYYLYCNKIGQSFPAERSGSIIVGETVLNQRVYLLGDYGVGWKVNSQLHKQQNKEVSKKCKLS
ncbi:MAG: hypothetical protein K2G16_02680 [Lachnospiraceae bacterium]|nr:hypothetical protein [Lachnospiraceae bacterium]